MKKWPRRRANSIKRIGTFLLAYGVLLTESKRSWRAAFSSSIFVLAMASSSSRRCNAANWFSIFACSFASAAAILYAARAKFILAQTWMHSAARCLFKKVRRKVVMRKQVWIDRARIFRRSSRVVQMLFRARWTVWCTEWAFLKWWWKGRHLKEFGSAR